MKYNRILNEEIELRVGEIRMKVAIIGAGVAGLTLAHVFEKCGIPYQVFEQHQELGGDHSGLVIAHNGFSVLQELKLDQKLLAFAQKISHLEYTDEKLQALLKIDFKKIDLDLQSQSFGVHQKEFLQMLISELPPHSVQFSHKVVGLSQRLDKTLIKFENGVSADYDLVVAADGMHSDIRKLIYPYIAPDFTGQTSWRFIVDHHFYYAPLDTSFEMWGKGNRFGIHGIGRGRWCWYAITNSLPHQKDDIPELKKNLQQLFSAFDPSVQKLIQNSPYNQMKKQDLYELPSLDSWIKGRLILIGDAAHGMAPSLSQGANQSMEDAWFLGLSLKSETNVEQALKDFVQLRKKKIQTVINSASLLGEVGRLHNGPLKSFRNKTMKYVPSFVFEQVMKRYLKLQKEKG